MYECQSGRFSEEKKHYVFPAMVDVAYDLYVDLMSDGHDITISCDCGMVRGCCFEDLAAVQKEADKAWYFYVIIDILFSSWVFPLNNQKEGK